MLKEYFDIKSGLNLEEYQSIEELKSNYREKLDTLLDNEELKKYFIWDFELLCCSEQKIDLYKSSQKRLTNCVTYCDGTKYPILKCSNFHSRTLGNSG